jgi:CelD/BcsL family acetyltransferase involved in cellulose biosynthesis
VGFRLEAGEQLVSAQFGFAYRSRYYAYLSALDPGFADFSAGRLHLGMVIEDCFARGLKGLELMPPTGRYKLEWNGTTRKLVTMSLAFTLRGLAIFTMLDHGLPFARRLSHALPGFIRKPLVNLLNRS